MFHCEMESINCRTYWSVKRTSQGSCLTLDTQQVYLSEVKMNQIRKQRKKDDKVRPETLQAKDSMALADTD